MQKKEEPRATRRMTQKEMEDYLRPIIMKELKDADKIKYLKEKAKVEALRLKRDELQREFSQRYGALLRERNEAVSAKDAAEHNLAACREVAAISRSRFLALSSVLWDRCDVDIQHKALYDAIIKESNKKFKLVDKGKCAKIVHDSLERDFKTIHQLITK